MITFKQYLVESEYGTSSIEGKDVIELLKTHCKKSMFNPIYRGFGWHGDSESYYTGDSSVLNRKSANTANFYTLFVDNSPAWAKFPKRSKSFIGSNTYEHTEDYGVQYLMIPYDDALVGICPESDFWFSFDLPEDLSALNFAVTDVMYGDYGQAIAPHTWEEMRDQFSKITRDVAVEAGKELIGGNSLVEFMDRFKAKTVLDLYAKILKPDRFKVVSGAEYGSSKLSGHHEVYVQGNVIFIKYDRMGDNEDSQEVLDFLMEKGIKF